MNVIHLYHMDNSMIMITIISVPFIIRMVGVATILSQELGQDMAIPLVQILLHFPSYQAREE